MLRPSMFHGFLSKLFNYSLLFPNHPIKKEMIKQTAKTQSDAEKMGPSVNATQLMATTGMRLSRTIARRRSCVTMKSAKSGE